MKKLRNVLQDGIITTPIKVVSHSERRRTGSIKKYLPEVKEVKKVNKSSKKPFKKRLDYKSYIHSKRWKGRRTAYLIKMGRKCAVCSDKKNLHIHHLSYENLGKEKDSDLVILCELHHDKFHEENGVKRDSKQETYKFIEEEQEADELREMMKNL